MGVVLKRLVRKAARAAGTCKFKGVPNINVDGYKHGAFPLTWSSADLGEEKAAGCGGARW